MEKIHDLEERYALEVQIGEFGQVPKQLFASPHPARIIFEGIGYLFFIQGVPSQNVFFQKCLKCQKTNM